MTPDSIVPDPYNPQALNRYMYVLGNPLQYTDPTGHSGWGSNGAGFSGGSSSSYNDYTGKGPGSSDHGKSNSGGDGSWDRSYVDIDAPAYSEVGPNGEFGPMNEDGSYQSEGTYNSHKSPGQEVSASSPTIEDDVSKIFGQEDVVAASWMDWFGLGKAGEDFDEAGQALNQSRNAYGDHLLDALDGYENGFNDKKQNERLERNEVTTHDNYARDAKKARNKGAALSNKANKTRLKGRLK